jgi:hypothetical protein
MAQQPSAANQKIWRPAEAERRRLGHPYLGDKHLLLGVLAHAANPAAAMLTERGLGLDEARTAIARIVAASGPVVADAATLLGEFGVDVALMRRRLESSFPLTEATLIMWTRPFPAHVTDTAQLQPGRPSSAKIGETRVPA